jgi:TonB family protein
MSKMRLVVSVSAIGGLLILGGGMGAWASPVRAAGQAAATGSALAENEIPPRVFSAIPPVKQVPVVYPPLAKMAGVQGKVRLRVKIDIDGSVMDVWVVSGHPLLVKAALEAVTNPQWRYMPSGEIRVTIVTIAFTLHQAGAAPLPRPAAKDITPPTAIYKPQPPYTKEAKEAKLEGTVVLEVTVEANGTVSDVKVIRPLGKGLDESAAKTVRTWKFKPATKAAKPVAWTGAIEVGFQMNRP